MFVLRALFKDKDNWHYVNNNIILPKRDFSEYTNLDRFVLGHSEVYKLLLRIKQREDLRDTLKALAIVEVYSPPNALEKNVIHYEELK